MTKILKKPRLFSNKPKEKLKPQIENNQSQILPNIQSFKQSLLSGNCFVEYK